MKSKKINTEYFSKFPEFDNLNFGTADDGSVYFDATNYLISKGDVKKHSIKEFELLFHFWKHNICDYYEIDKDDIIIRDENTDHIFIEEAMVFPFIMYIDPFFIIYILERTNELFMNGFTISDTVLYILAKDRLNTEVLNQLLNETK